MLTLLWLIFVDPSFVHAAPLLDPMAAFPVKVELKDAGPSVKAPESFYSEMDMDFQSFDPNDSSGLPLMGNHTGQLVKIKKLPKDTDKQAEKDGLAERLELTYERLTSSTSVVIPGMKQPFETKSDLGVFLMNKPLVIRGDGKTAKKVEGLEQVRAQAAAQVKEPMARNTLMTMLKEDLLLKTGAAVGQNSSCLGSLEKKKPGDTWKFSHEEQGVKLEYDCTFEGWAEAKGKKLAVIKVVSGKQRTVRTQPNGMPGVAETEGTGTVYFEPETQESLLRMETKINVEPGDEEIARLKAKGATIPRNKSLMKMWNHLYAI